MGPFYTYTIFADGVPVYVGKGQSQRCFDHLREKQELEGKLLTIKVEWAASERAALLRERALIAELSAEGTLLNIRFNDAHKARTKAGRLRQGVQWGPKGNRRFGSKIIPAADVARDLLAEADALMLHPRIGSPDWFADADRWLADHAHYEAQFDDWADGFETGFVRVMAVRRRFERVLERARAWCAGVEGEEYSYRLGVLTVDHPWLDEWVV